MTQLIRPLVIIALYALLLPVVGPALDHHYVEWQHNHGHAYLGSGAERGIAVHVHVYDSQGSHLHSNGSNPVDTSQLPEGVAYFGNYEGAGGVPIYAPTGPSTEILFCGGAGDCPLLASFDSPSSPLAGALIPPPIKPPAAILL